MKIRFTSIYEYQGVRLSTIAWKVEFLKPRWANLVVLPHPGVRGGRRRSRRRSHGFQTLDGLSVGLHGRMEGLDSGDQRVEGRLQG
jgi:hypothetical protein